MAKIGDTLYGRNQQPYVLREELGAGGEGTVYKTSDEKLVAKIYKAPNAQTERKILSMLKLNIEMKSPGGIPLITWPKDILYQNGVFAGYVMPFAGGGEPIWNMGRPDGRRKVFHGKYDWSKALAVATNISSLVSYLHCMGIVIGDMNSNNIFVHSNGYVTIMDVDSFDIRDKDTEEHFKCQVGRPEYLAPELQARRLSEESAVFTEQTDNFALAVHIFQLLFYAHPFNMKVIDRKEGSQGENQQVEAIVEGNCPFVKPGYEQAIQAGVPYMSMLPEYLQEDFRETFSYNALNSVQRREMRTKAVKWYQDLGKLYQEKDKGLIQCSMNPEHYYLRDRGCELCRAKQRLDDQNKRMAQWDIQSVCVNQQESDTSTSLDAVSSQEKWFSHYQVKNSPLNMSIPLYVRRTYPNGDSTEIQKLPQSYQTGDWISVEGSTQTEEQKRAGLYKIELFDAKQQLLVSDSIRVTEPSSTFQQGGSATQGEPGQQISVDPKVPFYKKRGIIVAAFIACAALIFMISGDEPETAPVPTSTEAQSEHTPTYLEDIDTTQTAQTRSYTTEAETEPQPPTTEAETTQPQSTEGNNNFMGDTPDAGTIRIINYTGREITDIYLSESSDSKWGDNRITRSMDHLVYYECKPGYQSSWDFAIVLEDDSIWTFMKLDSALVTYGSEVQVIYQDHGVFADIASNSTRWDGETINGTYSDPASSQTQETQPATEARSEYILPDSDKRYYTESELSNLTIYELRIARNELYARHGRIFNDASLQAYFDACSWYHGTVEASDFNEERIFNSYEKANRDLIKKLEGN